MVSKKSSSLVFHSTHEEQGRHFALLSGYYPSQSGVLE